MATSSRDATVDVAAVVVDAVVAVGGFAMLPTCINCPVADFESSKRYNKHTATQIITVRRGKWRGKL